MTNAVQQAFSSGTLPRLASPHDEAGAAPGSADDPVDEAFSPHALSRSHAAELRRRFTGARPFPHVVIDDLFRPEFLDRVLADYGAGFRDWVHYDTPNEVKTGTRPNARLGGGSQHYFDVIHRGAFTAFLTAVTGIEGLLPDPSLYGGGLHRIDPGGRFSVHVDFNKHPVTGLDNRLVFITYLNKDWKPEFGGTLELWDAETRQCVETVVPLFGRSILFAQSSTGLHGHPEPVAAPDGRSRRSVAAYYYTNGRPDEAPEPIRGTRFLSPVQSQWRRRFVRGAEYVSPMLLDGMRLAFRTGKRVARRLRR